MKYLISLFFILLCSSVFAGQGMYPVPMVYQTGGGSSPVTLGITTYNNTGTGNGSTVRFQATENFTAQSMSVGLGSGTGNLIMGIYDDSSNAPNNRIGVTSTASLQVGANCIDLTSGVSITSGNYYWFSWLADRSVIYAYLDTEPHSRYTNTSTYPTLSDPHSGASTTARGVTISISSEVCP